MRYKSRKSKGFQVFAVTGVNTISFGIDASETARSGLLGFSVERIDVTEDERYMMPGFKVFRSVIPQPIPNAFVSTNEHPIQSFVWDDFTAKENHIYEYHFQPLRGKPKNLDRSASPIAIRVRTETLYGKKHNVFFNRGVSSSQAYARRFGNLPPHELPTTAEQQAALHWLTRDLDEAMLKFINSAGPKDTLLCCFYEFGYQPIVSALAAAAQRIAMVKIIVDAKINAFTEADGTQHESFPRDSNLAAIAAAGLPDPAIIKRERNPSDIQHNKFMVLLKGTKKRPAEVWTGSTNLSLGAMSGQTNVGHWVRDAAVATRFEQYWQTLAAIPEPGSKKGDTQTQARAAKKALREQITSLQIAPTTLADIAPGTTAVFSPRIGFDLLDLYVNLVDQADALACITLAFGINARFKGQLADNTPQNHLSLLLLEKKDATAKNQTAFVRINASNNVYKAWGSYIKDPLYQWVRETNARTLGLNAHVIYVHSKFLLRDPLGDDPIVVTGSANFSEDSTTGNDENMLIIRGDRRVADIYFTEFNRLFNHYYFRSVTESIGPPGASELFLKETDREWLDKYVAGSYKSKRLKVFTGMQRFSAKP